MKQGCTKKPVGDICKILNGFAFKSNEYVDDGVRVLRITNVQKGYIVDDDPQFFPIIREKEISKYMLYEGDLLMSLTGNVGRVGVLSEEFLPAALNQRVACLRIKESAGVNLKYLFHIFNSKTFEDDCIVNATGIAQKNMSTKWLENYLIPVPPIAEQEKIVAELDCLSGIIEKKKQQLKELDNLAQSIFYEMFGNLGESIPVSYYITGLSAGKSLAGDEECPNKVLKTGAVTYDHFDGNQVKNLPLEYVPIPSHKVNVNDLLISRMNTAELVGACAYVWWIDDSIYLPDRLWRAEINKLCHPVYLWKALTTDKAKEQIRNYASGTSGSMKNISKSSFLNVQIPKAPLIEQQLFASKIEAIEKQKELIKQSIQETETLFNSRMDYYFN